MTACHATEHTRNGMPPTICGDPAEFEVLQWCQHNHTSVDPICGHHLAVIRRRPPMPCQPCGKQSAGFAHACRTEMQALPLVPA